jgi:hypothetical protein
VVVGGGCGAAVQAHTQQQKKQARDNMSLIIDDVTRRIFDKQNWNAVWGAAPGCALMASSWFDRLVGSFQLFTFCFLSTFVPCAPDDVIATTYRGTRTKNHFFNQKKTSKSRILEVKLN